MTEFQKAITKEHCIEICKLLHFTLTEAQLEKLQFSYKYTWVTVQFRVKGYGYISFAIDSHSSGAGLSGDKITKEDIQQALDRKAIDFKVWRFSDDEIYKRQAQASDYVQSNFKPPSVTEFYNNYYKD